METSQKHAHINLNDSFVGDFPSAMLPRRVGNKSLFSSRRPSRRSLPPHNDGIAKLNPNAEAERKRSEDTSVGIGQFGQDYDP